MARDQDVEHRADQQGADDADGHVALGVLGLLRGGADGVKPDIGEENKARPAHDARPAKFAPVPGVGRNERMPVGGIDGPNGPDDEEQHDGEFDEDDDVVEAGGLLDADDQQRRDKSDDEDGGQVENRRHVRQGGGSVPSASI